MKFDHLNQWTPRIFFLLVIILSFHFIRDVKYKGTKLGYVLDEGLEYRFSKEEEWKPYSFKQYISTKPDDLKIWIRIPIPKINPNSRFLFLRVIDGGSRFYFKGTEFYRSGIWSEDGKLIRFPNFFSHIIELPMEALGDVIEAEVYSDWRTVGIYLDIKLLTAGEIPLQFISDEMVYFVFSFFYLITGAASLLIYIFIKDPLFKYLGYVALSLCGISLFEMNVNISSFLWFDFSPFILYNSYLFLGSSLARFIGFMFGGFFLNYLTYYSTFLLAIGLYGNTAIYHFGFTKYYPDFVEIPLGIGAALGVLSMFVFSIYKSYLGDRNARIFVASIFIFQLGLFDYLAFQFGLTNKLEPDLYLRFFPIIISLIIIMALRYQDTKNELLEYTRMLEESKSQLETRVKEKTLDLEVANNQLVKAIHSKSEFFANVTHEFKTPLTLILSPLEKIMREERDGEKLFLLDIIKKNSIRIQSLVDDLLISTRIELGILPNQRVNISLNEYFNQIKEEFRVLSREKNLEFRFLPDPKSGIYLIDKIHWDIILRNLLSNALKFTKYGTIQMEYTILRDGSEIYIQISDTGIGIRKEETEKVWERFYQSDRNQLITATGTGIGLYLVKQLVENCRGKIHFESEELKGTRFHLHLPLVKSDKESEEILPYEKPIPETQNPNPFIQNHSINSHSNFIILFVEDEPKMKEYITYLLSGFYRIHSVDSVEDAWDEIQKGEYDLILSDWTLPGKNGIYLLNMLRSSEKKIPFLFLTARSEDSYLNEAFQTGADDFILKPFRNEDLLARIQNKIMKSKSQRKEIEEEKDSIYGDIHDMLGGKLADLKIQMDYLFQEETYIPIEKLRGIRAITDSMTYELRNKLHDWEDLRTSQSDFELAFMSMLLRRYAPGARSFKVKLEQGLDWKEANSWNSHKKTNVFRIVQEITNNDMKYGNGESHWKITSFHPTFRCSFTTNSGYIPTNLPGRGTRDIQERISKLEGTQKTSLKDGRFEIQIEIS